MLFLGKRVGLGAVESDVGIALGSDFPLENCPCFASGGKKNPTILKSISDSFLTERYFLGGKETSSSVSL